MTDIHPSPPNLVPTISSGALPQTPASEWAENATDVLGGHVTYPHVQPGVDQAPQDSLLASAQSYMPSLATAKAYLPQAVAAYLPDSTPAPSASESSLPPLPPSSASLFSAPPQQDIPVDVHHESYRTTSSAGDTFSTTAHTGHSSSAIAPPSPSFPSPPPSAPRATSGLLPSHPGVARESPSVSTLDSDAAANADVDLSTPQLVQSPILLAPGESTDLALAAESSSSAPSSLTASASTTQERDHPRPTSGLLPSHPGVAPSSSLTANVNAVPTASLDGVHPTPHVPMPDPAALGIPAFGEAASSTSTSLTSTPSLVPPSLTGGESGYAASSESVPTPGSESVPASALKTPVPTPTAPTDAYGGAHGGGGIQGGAALNSSRLEDNVPTGDFTPRVEGSAALNSSRFEDNVPTGDFTPRLEGQGSAALNSSRMEDNVPTGDMLVSPNRSEEADDDASSGSNSENAVDEDVDADADGEGKKKKSKKTKKPKLMQRLKERMHIGGSA
ncbi:hypothetical protein B0H13DRAFT_2270207 [Mycena leptocephala]|nr:hypothetical protein B0H13DRAFT_2270207 [Mycena leptocephala]